MASRMKNMFHRKKDDLQQQPSQYSLGSDPTLRASLYETTTPADLPQIGDYPIKGNNSSLMLHQGPGRKLSLRSRRSSGSSYQNVPIPSPTPDQYAGERTPRMDPPRSSNAVGQESSPPYQPRGQDETQKRRSQARLPREFANLSLGNEVPTTVTHTVTTTHFGHNESRYTPQPQAYTPPNSSSARPVSQKNVQQPRPSKSHKPQPPSGVLPSSSVPPTSNVPPPSRVPPLSRVPPSNYVSPDRQPEYGRDIPRPPKHQQYSDMATNGYEAQNHRPEISERDEARSYMHQPLSFNLPASEDQDLDRQPEYERDMSRKPSIPRKEVGSSTIPHQNFGSPQARSNDLSQIRTGRALPPPPVPTANRYGPRGTEHFSQHPSSLDGFRPTTQDATGHRSAQDVVARAKTNSKDTDVIETVAPGKKIQQNCIASRANRFFLLPAVVHEEVHKDIHHIREEVITREIHNHDVYHRVLPVIDVEVLPPRHFLPVEGGGLVEVSGQEVPGRGRNWVIAETASKIPSGQAAPTGHRNFTAREFPGREGDAVRYTAPEGHEKTEQTWVHPPELETGARDTGQSWPMIFGDGPPVKGSYGYMSPKASKKRTSKNASAVASSQAQQKDGRGSAA